MYVCVYGCNHIVFPQVVVAHSSVFLKVFIYLSIYQSVFKVRLYAHERERETERARARERESESEREKQVCM
jgi:hypothetical protein